VARTSEGGSSQLAPGVAGKVGFEPTGLALDGFQDRSKRPAPPPLRLSEERAYTGRLTRA
jgi:hypothetical protein